MDFAIVTDDERLFLEAEGWIVWNIRDYKVPPFVPDFFFSVDTNLDLHTLRSIRQNLSIAHDVLDALQQEGEGVVYTRKQFVDKYKKVFPKAKIIFV